MAESKSSSAAASVGWEDTDTWELIPEHEDGGATSIGAFATACPCCGQVIEFRLFCEADAHETENDQ